MKTMSCGKIFGALRLRVEGFDLPGLVRKILIGWLLAVTVEYLILPADLRSLSGLEGLARMSGGRIFAVTALVSVVLLALSRLKPMLQVERWALATIFAALAALTLCVSFTWSYLAVCLLALGMLAAYALLGWDSRPEPAGQSVPCPKLWTWATAALALGIFAFISIWTVARVFCMYVPTYDFGIFAQMFHNMKEIGLPMTTLERDGWLSHFDVHVSPIYYLMLPFYIIVPHPATLQVLQAAVMASAVIPLWKIGKHHGLSGLQRTLLCAVLLFFPAYCAGASYDLHENCFLTPLLLWLFYGIDKKNIPMTAIAGALTLMVKEDAAVYVAVIGLWLILKNLLRLKNADKWSFIAGFALLAGALGWFMAVTSYLAKNGDGVMNYRYNNFFFDGSGSLISVVKAVLLNPMKAVFECVDAGKLVYIGQTMLPLLGLPLLTRRFERYILLIPYLLINLMSDYGYQHNIFFQYNFGSIAFLIYLTAVNLSELKLQPVRIGALALSAVLGFTCFIQEVYPVAYTAVHAAWQYRGYYSAVHQALDTIPDDASVTASAFYTVDLAQRKTVYDIYYCSREHLLESEYVALAVNLYGDYSKHATPGKDDGYERLIALLKANGYELYHELDNILVIYKKK